MTKSETPVVYNWHVNLNRELKKPITILATMRNADIQEFISDTLKEKLQQVGSHLESD